MDDHLVIFGALEYEGSVGPRFDRSFVNLFPSHAAETISGAKVAIVEMSRPESTGEFDLPHNAAYNGSFQVVDCGLLLRSKASTRSALAATPY